MSRDRLAIERTHTDGSLARNSEDDSIVAAGGFREPFRGRDPGDRQDGVMTAFDDATGERIWFETVPGPEWLSVSKVWFAPNGDFAISGQASGPNNLQLPGAELNFDADDVLYMLRMR
ncbi:MAG: hypothetical protein AAGD14_01170 [Planctomycetota bacterium]